MEHERFEKELKNLEKSIEFNMKNAINEALMERNVENLITYLASFYDYTLAIKNELTIEKMKIK